MSGNHTLRDGTQPDEPQPAAEPFSATGQPTAAAQAVSPAAPVARGDDFALPDGPQAETDADAPRSDNGGPAATAGASEWRCTCGRPSTRWPGEYCDAHHPIPGTPGPALQSGLDAEHLPPADDIDLDQVADLLRRHVSRLMRSLDSRPLKLADLPLVERLEELVEKLRAREPQAAAVAGDGQGWDGWPQRLALVFANEPDHWREFLLLVLEADRARVGPLRMQTRLVLDHVEPGLGVPVRRGNKADDDDEVLL